MIAHSFSVLYKERLIHSYERTESREMVVLARCICNILHAVANSDDLTEEAIEGRIHCAIHLLSAHFYLQFPLHHFSCNPCANYARSGCNH